jgi:exodeoxyribonuclease VII large subunit
MAVSREMVSLPQEVTVSQLNLILKRILGETLPQTIHLVGEISNLTRAASGHLYLTLKDDRSEIRGVMWRSAASKLKFVPEDGLEVIATGHIDVYEPRGQYQFYVRRLQPRGQGALELAFRQLCDRLTAEGLFADDKKRQLPPYPQNIAIVTSPTGAAIRDILRTLAHRWPAARVMLHPVLVQGDKAAGEIASAIKRLNTQANALGGIDVMIVGRGGGSLEDLWPFNEEIVARAIAASRIPIITGIGHEVDITIADLAADVRAATPTAAAVAATPEREELKAQLDWQYRRIQRSWQHQREIARSQLDSAIKIELFRDPVGFVVKHGQLLDELMSSLALRWSRRLLRTNQDLYLLAEKLAALRPRNYLPEKQHALAGALARLQIAWHGRFRRASKQWQQCNERFLARSPRHTIQLLEHQLANLQTNMQKEMARSLQHARQHADNVAQRLEATSYHQTLARGFTLTRDAETGRLIKRSEDVRPGQKIETETSTGTFSSEVSEES